jgi:hypothetical protein
MPHDRNGEELEVGDAVNIPAIVTAIHEGENYCNVSLTSVEPLFPESSKTPFALNAKQVEKVS